MSDFEKKWYKSIGEALMFAVFIIIILPIQIFFSWIAGWIINLICGNYIANGLNLIFNTTRFTSWQIPMICVVLGVFSGYLRTVTTGTVDKS